MVADQKPRHYRNPSLSELEFAKGFRPDASPLSYFFQSIPATHFSTRSAKKNVIFRKRSDEKYAVILRRRE